METVALLAKFIKMAVDLGPDVIKGVQDAKPFAEQIFRSFGGKELAPGELEALEARIDSLAVQLQEPLPPE
jgi:hypothetical protein